MLGVYRVFRGYFVGVRCIINNPVAAKWQAVSSCRGRFIVPVYTCSPHIRKTLGHIWQSVSSCRGRFIVPAYLYSTCICNPFETHLCNVRNVFVICVLHIRRVKAWFLRCKSMVFGVQKGGFYFLASALLQCCDILAAFYSVYFSVSITILVFPRCVRFVCLCCQKPVAFVPFVPSQFCLLFVPHGQ